MRGTDRVRDRCRQAGCRPCRHIRHWESARHGAGDCGQQALRPQSTGDHQGAQSPAAPVPTDGGLRSFRPHRHRRALGIDDAGKGARGRSRLTTRSAGRASTTVAVIPAGGAGTRLWPRSRRSTPKHVLPLGGTGRPLLRDTYDRATKFASEVFVLTETGQREIVKKVLPEIDSAHLILEPAARGTTSAFGLAALTLQVTHPDAVMLLLPADHVVSGRVGISKAVRAAVRAAATTNSLVTVGLKPNFPSTGLG